MSRGVRSLHVLGVRLRIDKEKVFKALIKPASVALLMCCKLFLAPSFPCLLIRLGIPTYL